jgi:hypothetical protein
MVFGIDTFEYLTNRLKEGKGPGAMLKAFVDRMQQPFLPAQAQGMAQGGMVFKNFPYGGLLPELMPVRDRAYLPIRDTVAFKKGGKVAKPKAKKGSAEMKARMASLRKMKK